MLDSDDNNADHRIYMIGYETATARGPVTP